MCVLKRNNYYNLNYKNLKRQLHNNRLLKTHVTIRPLSKCSAFSGLVSIQLNELKKEEKKQLESKQV